MKNIATMTNHSPKLWNIIKIYWSIAWRANVLISTIAIAAFAFFPIALNFLIKNNFFDVFREQFFAIFPFKGNEPLIVYPTFLMRIYTNIWSFIGSYGLHFYGFSRTLKLNLYPAFLQSTLTFKDYSNAFLTPIAIYSFIDPGYFSNISYISSIIFSLILMILFYSLLFANLQKLCKRS